MFIEDFLLPRFEEWKGNLGTPLSLWEYASREGGLTLGLAYTSLLWPRLVEVETCILVAQQYDPKLFQQWKTQLGDQREAIEHVINHVHLWDYFHPASEGLAEGVLDALATIMAATWSAAAAAQFPERVCEVVAVPDGEDYGPTITLFSKSS